MVPIIEIPSADTSNAMSNFPVPYFFYGTPSDPKFLAKELELAEHPDMPKASIRGWRLKMWGEYKALVDHEATEHDMLVEGEAYRVQNEEQLGKLAA